MIRPLRRRFWLEAGLGAAALVLAVVTLISREWIEEVFKVDPDGGNGSLEWFVVIGLAALAAVCGYLARRESRRLAPA